VPIDGVRFNCPACKREGFLRREQIEGDAPLMCPNDACRVDLSEARGCFRQCLAQADKTAATYADGTAIARELLSRRRRKHPDHGPTVH